MTPNKPMGPPFQLRLGHADLKTTQRYLNLTDEELRKTMQQKLWSRES